jgi:hypothetical protein
MQGMKPLGRDRTEARVVCTVGHAASKAESQQDMGTSGVGDPRQAESIKCQR